MTRINLIDGYFNEIDEMNATLRQAYTGRTKDGKERPATRNVGYYSPNDIAGALAAAERGGI